MITERGGGANLVLLAHYSTHKDIVSRDFYRFLSKFKTLFLSSFVLEIKLPNKDCLKMNIVKFLVLMPSGFRLLKY